MRKRALITGGAGFIGANLAVHLLRLGWKVTLFDNLSRKGTDKNISWIQEQVPEGFLTIEIADIRDYAAVKRAVAKSDVIYHLAAQVAVTTSYVRPREDFAINLGGAINILEAARESGHKPIILYASTNKVYGSLDMLGIAEQETRYTYRNPSFVGVSEEQLIDFHSPYGCSKGAADQYIRDYFRMYGIPTVVFRQSCIYGPRQMGMEDQGWAAHFAIKASLDDQITLYGNGKQVRDLLHVSDLINAYQLAIEHIATAKGKIYNIGGGAKHAFSLLDYIAFLERITGKKIAVGFEQSRPGDQLVYISDTTKITNELGWKPAVCHTQGLAALYDWVQESLALFKQKKQYADLPSVEVSSQQLELIKK